MSGHLINGEPGQELLAAFFVVIHAGGSAPGKASVQTFGHENVGIIPSVALVAPAQIKRSASGACRKIAHQHGHHVASVDTRNINGPATRLLGCNNVFIQPGTATVRGAVKPDFFLVRPCHINFTVGAISRHRTFCRVVVIQAIAFELAE